MLRVMPRAGRRGIRFLPALGLAVAVACTAAPPRVVPGPAAPEVRATEDPRDFTQLNPVVDHNQERPGVSLVSVFSSPVFVFGYPVPTAEVQPSSLALADIVRPKKRLKVSPLPSPTGTAAIHVLEESRFVDKWGSLSTPAQRTIYARFAADEALGDWLVLVTDVRVVDGRDPVPVTAYRWPRLTVEEYAKCGIPPVGNGVPWTRIDQCTNAFFTESEIALVAPGAKVNGI